MSYADEPDPFLDIRMVQYPIAVLQPRQKCPVIEVPPRSPFQLSSTGVPLSTGTVWAGAAYDVDADDKRFKDSSDKLAGMRSEMYFDGSESLKEVKESQ